MSHFSSYARSQSAKIMSWINAELYANVLLIYALNDGKIAEMVRSSDKYEESGNNDDHHIMNIGEKYPQAIQRKICCQLSTDLEQHAVIVCKRLLNSEEAVWRETWVQEVED